MAAPRSSRSAREDGNFGSLFDLFSPPSRSLGWSRVPAGGGRRATSGSSWSTASREGAVNRVPQANDIRSNMVRGGAAQAEPTHRSANSEICATIGPELRKRGLLFVGIDVIDGYLTEINVTSPTGIRAVKRLGGPDLAVAIWDTIEAKVTRK